jgi:prepilin-type N-terminal cleavage/methylation domain-containing protein
MKRNTRRAGFTATEILIGMTIGSLVSAAVMTTFIWCGEQSAHCAKIAWSQQEALATAEKLTLYIRNATDIVAIDEDLGTWVDLAFPDGSVGRLVYSNNVPMLRDGRMYLKHTNGTELIVSRGLTEIQDAAGFTTPVFYRVSPDWLHVAYRVSEPTPGGWRDSQDGNYAAVVSFGVGLRNRSE